MVEIVSHVVFFLIILIPALFWIFSRDYRNFLRKEKSQNQIVVRTLQDEIKDHRG